MMPLSLFHVARHPINHDTDPTILEYTSRYRFNNGRIRLMTKHCRAKNDVRWQTDKIRFIFALYSDCSSPLDLYDERAKVLQNSKQKTCISGRMEWFRHDKALLLTL
jgi:hypothetical protein